MNAIVGLLTTMKYSIREDGRKKMHEDYVRNTTMCLHPMKVDLIKSAAVVGVASQNLLQVLVISWQHAFYKKIFIKISFNGAQKID